VEQPVAEVSDNKMVRNLCRVALNKPHEQLPAKNEMFARGRMAYIVELGEETEGADDVPATLMRSAQECPDPSADNLSSDAVLISVNH